MKQKANIAFWEESFQKEFEGKTIVEGVLIWYFSGACFAVRTPRTLLFLDPYFGGDPVEAAPDTYRTTQIPLDPAKVRTGDYVFITHNHYDHCHEDTLKHLVQNSSVKIFGPPSTIPEMQSYGIPAARMQQVKPGDRVTAGDIEVTVWPGYDKDEPQGVTYLFESGGVRIFFNGDGADGATFDEIGARGDLDVAMLAFGRTWYMSEARMLEAAQRLRPKLLLPYHWELWRGHTGDPLELGRLVERRKPNFQVQLLQVGDFLHCHPDGRFTKGR